MATERRRAQSFAHLPRPRLSHEELIRYLGDRATAGHGRDSNAMDDGVDSGAVLEEGVDGVNKIDAVEKDGDPQVSGANLNGGREAIFEGGPLGSGDRSEAMHRKRLLRRWPSSADTGMVTDGR